MPRFVILEHTWNGVHWDIMLEFGEVLRTWAIDTPISGGWAVPVRSMADHRIAYLEYEGPVSANRGHVRRWDTGTYHVNEWSDTLVRVELRGTQLFGLLELRAVAGATGSWSLVFVPRKLD